MFCIFFRLKRNSRACICNSTVIGVVSARPFSKTNHWKVPRHKWWKVCVLFSTKSKISLSYWPVFLYSYFAINYILLAWLGTYASCIFFYLTFLLWVFLVLMSNNVHFGCQRILQWCFYFVSLVLKLFLMDASSRECPLHAVCSYFLSQESVVI